MTAFRTGLATLGVLIGVPLADGGAQLAGVDSVVVSMHNSGFRMGNALMRIDALGRVRVASSMDRGSWAIGDRAIPSGDAQAFIAVLDTLSPPPRRPLVNLTDEGCVQAVTDANIIDFTVFRADTATTISHYLGCRTYRDANATARGKTLDNLTAWTNAVAAGLPPPKSGR